MTCRVAVRLQMLYSSWWRVETASHECDAHLKSSIISSFSRIAVPWIHIALQYSQYSVWPFISTVFWRKKELRPLTYSILLHTPQCSGPEHSGMPNKDTSVLHKHEFWLWERSAVNCKAGRLGKLNQESWTLKKNGSPVKTDSVLWLGWVRWWMMVFCTAKT